jgi:putative YhbY family RNA-binding protein
MHAMRTLTPADARAYRAKAHSLHPVVTIGHHGLTPAVLHEIDVNLLAHQLIKIRVFGDDRGEREALLARICDGLDAAPVQHLGKILTIWRPVPASGAGRVAQRIPRKAGPTPKDAAARAQSPATPRAGAPRSEARAARGRSVIEGMASPSVRRWRSRPRQEACSEAPAAPHGKSASSRVERSGAPPPQGALIQRPAMQSAYDARPSILSVANREPHFSYSRRPPGACTSAVSPSTLPISARAIGELTEILPCFKSASSSPTI